MKYKRSLTSKQLRFFDVDLVPRGEHAASLPIEITTEIEPQGEAASIEATPEAPFM